MPCCPSLFSAMKLHVTTSFFHSNSKRIIKLQCCLLSFF
uniref:Uncharacterized protein n=1 Tax=Anguilla anguilla TaxID=7936 RepID=A0A0E9XPC4_ANGAN